MVMVGSWLTIEIMVEYLNKIPQMISTTLSYKKCLKYSYNHILACFQV